jgi:iron complex outermembrane receptor protein
MKKEAKLVIALLGTTALFPWSVAQAEPVSDMGTVTITGVTGHDAGGGLMIEEDASKQRSTVTTDFIATQSPTSNPFNLIKLLPGANVSAGDAFGVQNSSIAMHGFFSNEIGTTVEGIPLNDSGSFALYPSEWIDSENVSQITLTQGSPDIDMPFTYSTGGTINITMNDPYKDPSLILGQSVGSHAAIRSFARVDTGETDTGIAGVWKAYMSASYYDTDHYTGAGDDERDHVDFKAVHEWGDGNRFAPVVLVNRGILDNYAAPTMAQWNATGMKSAAYPTTLFQTVSSPLGNAAQYYYQMKVNPFVDAIAATPTHFQINNAVGLDVRPYFWYGYGNGGGSYYTSSNTIFYGTTPVPSSNPGNATLTAGKYSVYYSPSMQETYRPGLVSKVTWEVAHHNLYAGYWVEWAYQHQWEPLGYISGNGVPQDIWGDGHLLTLPDGAKYTAYDETTQTLTNSLFVGDTITLLNERLSLDFGVRQAFVNRDARNNELATPDLALWPTNDIKQFRAETLPNVAVHFKVDDANQVFGDFTTNFRVPNTFPTLYGSLNNPSSAAVYDLPTPNLKDEKSYQFEAGWRYQDGLVDSSVTGFGYMFHDRQWSINIPQSNSSNYFTEQINIGNTIGAGVDAEIGLRPVEHWRPYVSAEYLFTRLEDNIPTFGTVGRLNVNDFLPTVGKQVPRSPKEQFGLGLSYDDGHLFGNVVGKYTGGQYSTFMNDERISGFGTADLTLGYRFDDVAFAKQPEVRINIVNATNLKYLSGVYSTQTNARTVTGVNGATIAAGSAPTYNVGAPFAAMVTVTGKF